MVEESAGLVVLHGKTMLLGHPTGQKWYGTYSIPKGRIEEGEDVVTAAIRETFEETGLQFAPYQIDPDDRGLIEYTDAKGDVYKRVHFFVVWLDEPIEPDSYDLGREEIDWAGFLTLEEAEKRIFWRFRPLLDLIR